MDRKLMRWKCNSCGGTYTDTQADGTAYFHTCPPEQVEHATVNAGGVVTQPEKRTTRADFRDERPAPNLIYQNGVPMVPVLVPGERALYTYVPTQVLIVSEGKGRTQIE